MVPWHDDAARPISNATGGIDQSNLEQHFFETSISFALSGHDPPASKEQFAEIPSWQLMKPPTDDVYIFLQFRATIVLVATGCSPPLGGDTPSSMHPC